MIIIIKSYHEDTGRQLGVEEFKEWDQALDDVIDCGDEDRIYLAVKRETGKPDEIVTDDFEEAVKREIEDRRSRPSMYDEHNIMNHAQLGIV